MNKLLLLVLAAVILPPSLASAHLSGGHIHRRSGSSSLSHSQSLFHDFKVKYNKQYDSAEEESTRLRVFRKNLVRIAALNKLNKKGGGTDRVFGVTAFADQTPQEFAATHLGYIPSREHRHHQAVVSRDDDASSIAVDGFSIDDSIVDWRLKGAISPVKDQGNCSSCWAFSAAEQIESNWFLSGKAEEVPILSPQQLVSCDTQWNYGCDGGRPRFSFDYVREVGGIDTEAAYPYTSGLTSETGKCEVSTKAFAAQVTGYKFSTPQCLTDACNNQNETSLAESIAAIGPASIILNAQNWQHYTSGVMTALACGDNGFYAPDHAVQLVGYNSGASLPYWIVRNSWKATWGEAGYIYLEMNGKNTCGLANEAVYVIV